MNEPPRIESATKPLAARAGERALHRLFLTLFLRGRSARGLQKQGMPQSVGKKLALVLCMYGLIGFMAISFIRQPVFALSIYLHTMTLVFLGMFVAASSGEILFNKEEADILLHRPITAGALLWAKIGVLVRVSLWMAGAFNLTALVVGIFARDGGVLYPLAHVVSVVLEALFCTGSVVLLYQLCLRWFGRERLDGLMTMSQVVVAVAAVLAGQIPQFFMRIGGKFAFNVHAWWVYMLPPAWFAGFDDFVAGSRAGASLGLAALGVATTAGILWLAFKKLAKNYESGLQSIGESRTRKQGRGERRRWLDALAERAPLRWWLRDPVSRASFLLVAAYLARDRDVKLRVYPGLAPMLVWPMVMFLQDHGSGRAEMPSAFSGYFVAFSGVYVGIIPLLGLELLRYSQQWQAADLFRAAPMRGPGPLCDGARRAVLLIVTVPVVAGLALLAKLTAHGNAQVALLLPGIIALPAYAMMGCLGGKAVPLSKAGEEAKSASRGLLMIGVMMFSALFAIAVTLAWNYGYFKWLLAAEAVFVGAVYFSLREVVASARWDSME